MEGLGLVMFNDTFAGKKVLITGHTGFKGSWLSHWLLDLGANVVGISKDIPTDPSLFEVTKLEGKLIHYREDIRSREKMHEIIHAEKPDIIFHLAAQPLVSLSYEDPLDTLSTNIMGSAHVLDSLRDVDWPVSVVMIATDKCYHNEEWVWGYRENDPLGGKDIYSASKGAGEIVFRSFYKSFFSAENCNVRLASGRAGNVIGGGDWAKDRIVTDAMRAWASGGKLTIRNPNSIRPWQHVLESLSGYMKLAVNLLNSPDNTGMSFNFGPGNMHSRTVHQLLEEMAGHWGGIDLDQCLAVQESNFAEARLLKLNSDLAAENLNWHPVWDFHKSVEATVNWYKTFYSGATAEDMTSLTVAQIRNYQGIN